MPDPVPTEHQLSDRARRLVEAPVLAEYILAHFAHTEDAWDAEQNPDGYVALCIAENRMMWDELGPKLASYDEVPARVLGYDAMIGALEFRTALATFMGTHILGRAVDAEQLAVVAGAGAVLELLFHALADAGEGVLVPTPSYAGFWSDLETRDALKIIPVHGASAEGFRITPADLDRAMAEAEVPVRALLFTTPNNPMGWVYGRDELEAILAWAERRSIHVVFDEIYALSVFGERAFVSAASLRERLGPLVHIVWAFSKDFGASGLRCGVLVSENPSVRAAVDALAYWCACSGDTQYRLGRLIGDEEFMSWYLSEMPKRLGAGYAAVTRALDAAAIPYFAAEAGFFLLVDLRAHLREPSWAAEAELWRTLLSEARVNLTPGSACRIAEPGFFRLCYASEAPAAVDAAMDRIVRCLGAQGAIR